MLDPTVASDVFAGSSFLYAGANPIQTGVVPGTIKLEFAALINGKVTTPDGAPLPAVKVTVLSHPEFGRTFTRADGRYDLVVNGGTLLTLRYERAGFLAVQRQLPAPIAD